MNYSEPEPTASPDDELVVQAMQLLPEIGRLFYASISRYQQTCGLSLGQIKAMWYLSAHGRRTVGEIATGMGVSMPTASELLDRLVEAGLAERAANPDDRRQVLVWLTPAAERLATDMRAMRRSQLRAALARLAPDERPVFVRSLAALVAALDDGPCVVPSDRHESNAAVPT